MGGVPWNAGANFSLPFWTLDIWIAAALVAHTLVCAASSLMGTPGGSAFSGGCGAAPCAAIPRSTRATLRAREPDPRDRIVVDVADDRAPLPITTRPMIIGFVLAEWLSRAPKDRISCARASALDVHESLAEWYQR